MSPIITVGIKAARRAGSIILRYLDRLDQLSVEKKGRNDFVSEVDRMAEEDIVDTIHYLYPHHRILAEESGQALSPKNGGGGGRGRTGKNQLDDKDVEWIIDPLDGTKEFCQLRDDWGVHVALTLGGACAIGVVYLPSQETLVWGVAVPGRERVGIDGPGQLAAVDSGEPGRVVVSRSHTPPWVEAFAQEVGAGELIPFGGCGNKTIQLMTDQADIYVHKIGLKEWDTCAPESIARAAGWTVRKLDGSEHRYNQPDPHNHEYVMCRPGHLEQVLSALQTSGALD